MAGRSVQSNVVIRINDREITNTFRGIGAEVSRLQRELRGMVVGSEEYIRTSQELRSVRSRFQEIRNEINGTSQDLQRATTSQSGFMNSFAGNVAADFFANATAKVLEWGDALKERVEQLTAIKSLLLTLDENLKGGALNKAAASVQAIADTYDKGVEEIIAAVKGLNAQTGDTGKSLDLIKQGFLAGADASGEMLTQLKEYPTMMNDAKISAEEMIAIMAQSEKMGIYDDKGIDALKEGMLRVREGTKNTVDAMKGLGVDTDEVYKKISSGAMSYFDVLKIVSGKLKETGADSRITGTAIADIFGGPGEDAGYKYLSQLQEINTNLNDLTASTDENVLAKNKELEANEKLNNIWVQLTGTASVLNRMYSSLKIGMADLLSYTFGIKESKLSDEYLKQSTRLDMLNIKLSASNISQGEKLRLYQQLKTEFPQHFKNLDLERMKHNEIAQAIRNASNEMRKKYQLQALQETVDEKGGDFKDASSKVNNSTRIADDNIQKAIQKIPSLKNIKGKSGTTGETLALIYNYLERNKEIEGNSLTLRGDIRNALTSLNSTIEGKNKAYSDLNKEIKFQQKQTKDLGLGDVILDENPINTPSTDADAAAIAAAAKKAAAEKKAAEKNANKLSADNKKLQDEIKKELDASVNDVENAEKNKLDIKEKIAAENFKNQVESLQKELAVQENARQEELRKLKDQGDAIDKTILDLEKKKLEAKSPVAKSNYDKALKEELEARYQNDLLIQKTEETHGLKLKTIREKWEVKKIDDFVKSEAKLLGEKFRAQEEDIQNITSIEEAKEILQNSTYLKLTDNELKQIDTLEKAKAALREEANRKMLDAQLTSMEAQREMLIGQISQLADGPEKKKLLEDLDTLKTKILEVRGAMQSGENSDKAKATDDKKSAKSKVDILGFSAQDWEESFDNIDTLSEGIKAAGMVFSALGNAAGMYAELQRALGEKELKNFEKIQNSKKTELDRQLALGLISQEEYKKQTMQMDADLANKQAEIEYKQAKAEKVSKLFSAIGSTAAGVAAALPNFVLAGIVGAIGAVQIATIAAQPLPEPPSYAEGGYFEGFTGESNLPADSTGERPVGLAKLHRKEFVVPRWMTEHPVISKRVNELDYIRRTKNIPSYAEGGFTDPNTPNVFVGNNGNSGDNADKYYSLILRVETLLQYLSDEGLIARFADDAKTYKKLNRGIKDYQTLVNNSKH